MEKKFPQDIITPYKKGARGPDCLQTIREDAISLGNIMIESKDTKKWDKFWVEKLSKDMQKKNAQIGVIVSVTLPNGVDGCQYFHNNRIIVSPMNFNILDAIIMAMRTMIVNIYKTNKLNKGSSNKATKLWEYCRSPSFQIAIERFVQEFIKEQEQLDKDDRTFQLSKKERQKRIDSKKEIFNEFISGIKSLSDMKGKRVFTGPPSGAASVNMEQIIEIATGLKPGDDYEAVHLAWGEGAQAMMDGKLDVFFNAVSIGSANVEQISITKNVRFLGLDTSKLNDPEYLGYLKVPGRAFGEIPPNTYVGQVNETAVTVPLYMMIAATRADLSDEVVYEVTKAFWENLEDVHHTAAVLQGDRDLINFSTDLGYPISSWPTFVFVDRDLNIFWGIYGYSEEYMRIVIEDML